MGKILNFYEEVRKRDEGVKTPETANTSFAQLERRLTDTELKIIEHGLKQAHTFGKDLDGLFAALDLNGDGGDLSPFLEYLTDKERTDYLVLKKEYLVAKQQAHQH